MTASNWNWVFCPGYQIAIMPYTMNTGWTLCVTSTHLVSNCWYCQPISFNNFQRRSPCARSTRRSEEEDWGRWGLIFDLCRPPSLDCNFNADLCRRSRHFVCRLPWSRTISSGRIWGRRRLRWGRERDGSERSLYFTCSLTSPIDERVCDIKR